MAIILDDDYLEFLDDLANERVIRPKRYLRDMENPIEFFNEEDYFQRFRFSKHVVLNTIIPLIRIPQPNSNRGLPIPLAIQICITLRFFATGSFQNVCGDLQHLHQSTVSRIISKCAKQIAQHLKRFVHFPQSQAALDRIKLDFLQKARFPYVLGCIDCTHIKIISPGGPNAEVFRNRKHTMSINVQVVGGPNLEILDIVIRWPGSAHDSRIFDNSAVKMRFENGELPGYLLGDAGYRQTRYLFTPLRNVLTESERRYNRAHKVTRVTVERLFGVWKKRFPCLDRTLKNKLTNSLHIIAACAVLHNIGRHDRMFEFEDTRPRNEENPEIVPENRTSIAIRRAFIQRHFQ